MLQTPPWMAMTTAAIRSPRTNAECSSDGRCQYLHAFSLVGAGPRGDGPLPGVFMTARLGVGQ
jgi:hypothetical protein